MNAEEFSEKTLPLEGWSVRVTTYRMGDTWHAKADNVSPGAALARATGATREEAEQGVLRRAAELLARTRRRPV
jgi:hypothetical protein